MTPLQVCQALFPVLFAYVVLSMYLCMCCMCCVYVHVCVYTSIHDMCACVLNSVLTELH